MILQQSVFVNRYILGGEIVAYTEFGKSVKKRLIDLGQNQEWLYAQVREKTGMYFDSSYLYKIMTGRCSPEKMVRAISEVLDIPVESGPTDGS